MITSLGLWRSETLRQRRTVHLVIRNVSDVDGGPHTGPVTQDIPDAADQPTAHPRWHRLGMFLAIVVVGMLGAGLGLLLAGSTRADAGPFVLDLSLRPSTHAETVIEVPPLGEIALDTHAGPLQLDVRVAELNEADARRIVKNPTQLASLGEQVNHDVRAALLRLLVKAVLVAILGAAALGFLVFRTPRRTVLTGVAAVAALLGTSGLAAATYNRDAIDEPTYTGLLASAPAAVGSVRDIVGNVDRYSQALGKLVGNVTQLYDAASGLRSYQPADNTIRVLSVSDLHLSPTAFDVIRSTSKQFRVDLIVDTGDSTDYGSSTENAYVNEIGSLGLPYVWVRGNHDSTTTQAAVKALPNTTVLDGPEVRTVKGLRFVGIGDPRFTPDKTTGGDDAPRSLQEAAGKKLCAPLIDGEEKVDIVMVHEPAAAEQCFGAAPLVLAGHTHKRSSERKDGTLLLVQGSTGGAGARSLEGDNPTPLEMSVLYLDPSSKRVLARDDITLGGLGLSSATIDRTVEPALTKPGGASPSPSASTSPGSSGLGSAGLASPGPGSASRSPGEQGPLLPSPSVPATLPGTTPDPGQTVPSPGPSLTGPPR